MRPTPMTVGGRGWGSGVGYSINIMHGRNRYPQTFAVPTMPERGGEGEGTRYHVRPQSMTMGGGGGSTHYHAWPKSYDHIP